MASTGAPESCEAATPSTRAWCPSRCTRAPSRSSSAVKPQRASKTFSVMIPDPSATAFSATTNGWRSVGKPGYGRVETLMARGRLGPWTVNRPSATSTSHPAARSLSRTTPRWDGSAPLICTRPPVTAAAKAHVPATIRSGTVRCVTGLSRGTPVIVSVVVPSPSICAPMACSMRPMSTISGSRATFSSTVVPRAVVAAVMRFSVAPTEGYPSRKEAPASPSGADARRKPRSMPSSAPIASRPARCMSRPRVPMASPPGSATSARRHLAISGPSTEMEARMARTRS